MLVNDRECSVAMIFENGAVRFVLIGIAVSLIDIGLTYLFVQMTGTRFAAVTVGYIAGLLASYVLHARVSFSVSLAPRDQVPKFAALVALNYLQTIAIVLLLTDVFHFSTIAGKVASLPFVAIASYFISRHWVYRRPKP